MAGGGKTQGTMGPACAEACPCDAETWDGLRWCHCPGAPKDAFCRSAGCFAVYGGQSSTFENNQGFECGGGGGLVSFGAKWAAIHGHRELRGLFGGAWNSSSSTRVVGNTIDGIKETSRQCTSLSLSLSLSLRAICNPKPSVIALSICRIPVAINSSIMLPGAGSFEAPIDPKTNRSIGRDGFPGSIVCEI